MLNPFIFFQMFSMVQWAIELYVALTDPRSCQSCVADGHVSHHIWRAL